MKNVRVEPAFKSDLDAIVEAEQLAHPGEPWAWTAGDVTEVMTRKFGPKTRFLIGKLIRNEVDNRTGRPVEIALTAGGVLYEILEDRYELLLLTAHDGVVPRREEVFDALLGAVSSRAAKRGKGVAMHVPDGNYRVLKHLMDKGWSWKRVGRHFGSDDAWLCQAPAKEEKTAKV